MKRPRLLASLLLWPGVALTQAPGPAPDAAARAAIDVALSWVSANSTYKPVPLRKWRALKAEDMSSRAWWLHVAADPSTVFSMYSCAYHTLYFRRDADFADPVVFSYLVHEVTHHLQCEHARFGPDLCSWEREAYQVQGAYLNTVIEAGAKDGKPLGTVQLAAAKETAADLGQRADAACGALRRGP